MDIKPTTKKQADILWEMGMEVYYRNRYHPIWTALGYSFREVPRLPSPSEYLTFEWGVEVE